MFERDELGNYRVSSLFFVIFIIISFVFVWYSVFSEDNNLCVQEVAGIDLMDSFENWIPHRVGREDVWNAGVEVPLTEEGYPRVIPFKKGPDLYAVKTVLYGTSSYIEDGVYVLSFKGNGKLKIGFDAEESTFDKAGNYNVLVLGSGKGVYLEIIESDILDPIRDIHLYPPIKKELKSCEVKIDETIKETNNEEDYIVVSNTDLVGSVDNLEVDDGFNWKDKTVTGLITLFAILAVIYILK